MLFVALLGGEAGDGFEALDLAGRTIPAVDGFLPLVGRTLFGGVEEVLEGVPDLAVRLAVCEPEPEPRSGERGGYAEQEQRILRPGEHEEHGERRPEYAPEREVLPALVGEIGGEVGVAAVFVDLLDPELDGVGLE